MYQAYWGLTQSPFAPALNRQLAVQHPLCSEALARLDFLADHRSRFGLLIGPPGSGKSLVFGEFVRRRRAAGSAVALIDATGMQATEVLLELAASWGCDPVSSSDIPTLWRLATDRLAALRLEQVQAVLVLDNLDQAASETRTTVQRLLQLPDVEVTVAASACDDAVSRLGHRLLDLAELRIELALWTAEDTRDYLSGSLAAAGRHEPAFADQAVERLFQLSAGLPRRLGQLAQLALIAGAGQNLTQIDEQTVLAVHEELSAAR